MLNNRSREEIAEIDNTAKTGGAINPSKKEQKKTTSHKHKKKLKRTNLRVKAKAR